MGKSGSSSPALYKRQMPRIASLVVDTLARRMSGISHNSSSSSNASDGSLRDLHIHGHRRAPSRVIPDIEPIPHAGLARSEEWASVQNAIWSIFHSKQLSSSESSTVHLCVRRLAQTELGQFIYDYYRNKLMPRGMAYLADIVKSHEDGHLKGIEEVWDNFYKEILSNLKVVLHLIPIKEHNIRQLTLLGFRDYVLLQTDIESVFEMDENLEITPTLKQMLLVLQSVRISNPPSENYIRLERLVGRAVNPYLGYLGVYDGSSEPTYPSVHYSSHIVKSNVLDDISRAPIRRRPRRTTFSTGQPLEPVKEMTPRDHMRLAFHLGTDVTASPPVAVRRMRDNKGRRHSCDVLF